METENRLKDALKGFDQTSKNDHTVVEYSEALNEFKKMLEEGIVKPRGHQLEDAINRNSYSNIHPKF